MAFLLAIKRPEQIGAKPGVEEGGPWMVDIWGKLRGSARVEPLALIGTQFFFFFCLFFSPWTSGGYHMNKILVLETQILQSWSKVA